MLMLFNVISLRGKVAAFILIVPSQTHVIDGHRVRTVTQHTVGQSDVCHYLLLLWWSRSVGTCAVTAHQSKIICRNDAALASNSVGVLVWPMFPDVSRCVRVNKYQLIGACVSIMPVLAQLIYSLVAFQRGRGRCCRSVTRSWERWEQMMWKESARCHDNSEINSCRQSCISPLTNNNLLWVCLSVVVFSVPFINLSSSKTSSASTCDGRDSVCQSCVSCVGPWSGDWPWLMLWVILTLWNRIQSLSCWVEVTHLRLGCWDVCINQGHNFNVIHLICVLWFFFKFNSGVAELASTLLLFTVPHCLSDLCWL